MQSKLKMSLCIAPAETSFCKLLKSCKKILLFSKRWCNCSILCKSCCSHNWPILCGKKTGKKQIEIIPRVSKNVILKGGILPHYQNSWFFLNHWYFKYSLMWKKCLVAYELELTGYTLHLFPYFSRISPAHRLLIELSV